MIATACVLTFTASDSTGNGAGENIGWREIEAGTHSAIEEAMQLVIRDANAWRDWWKRHTQNIEDATQPDGIKPPDVDFTKEMVIVATLGMRSTGGYQVRFTGVVTEGETLNVTLQTTSPGPGSMVTMAFTNPFAIIALPQHKGEVLFQVK